MIFKYLKSRGCSFYFYASTKHEREYNNGKIILLIRFSFVFKSVSSSVWGEKDLNILPWIQTQHLYFVYPRRLSWSISTHNFAWNYYNESLYPAIKMRSICSIAMVQRRKSLEYMISYLNRIHRLIWNRNCVFYIFTYLAKSSIGYTRLINNYIFA